MKPIVPKLQRCAIYTRKSTEHNLDLEFNSLDAQREACEAYIKSQAHEGWRLVPGRYDDGGLSGASTALPCKNSWPMSGPARSPSWWSIRSTASPARSPTSPSWSSCSITGGLFRVDHPVIQHYVQHGPAHPQRAAFLCPVRARGDRR